MKCTIIQLLLFLFGLTGGTLSQDLPPLPPLPDKDPFVGTWQANRDKSQPRLGDADASYVRTLAREGDDRVFSSRIVIRRKVYEHRYRIRCDGAFHPVPSGSVSCAYRASNLVVGVGSSRERKGKIGYWMEEVSSDSREMRIFEYEDEARTRLKKTWVFDRLN